MPEHILVAVAWPYANGPRHIGHVAGFGVPADIFARYHRLRGNRVLMVSGTDEHGTPITLVADKEGTTPQAIADRYNKIIGDDLYNLGLSYDTFTRTTTANHYAVTQDIFRTLYERGYIIRQETLGAFSATTGRTLPDRYIEGTCPLCGYDEARGDQCDNCGSQLDPTDLINPRSKVDGQPPVFKPTEHFFLDLPAFAEQLHDWINRQDHWRPNVRNFSLNFLKDLKPRAITRDLEWGVPIPLPEYANRDDKKIYVWFDAVIGYLSASIEWAQNSGQPDAWREWWQNPDARHFYFMGKDNIVFHTVIWPAMLLGYGAGGQFGADPGGKYDGIPLQLPYNVVSSEFLTMEGKKFSSSRGIVIYVNDFLSRYDADALRYFLTIAGPENQDTDFTWAEFVRRNNDELVATWGNLVNRTLSNVYKNFGSVPQPGPLTPVDEQVLAEVTGGIETVGELLAAARFKAALAEAMRLAAQVNIYLSEQEPWKVIKSDHERAATIWYVALRCVDTLKIIFTPFLPFSSQRLHEYLGYNGYIAGPLTFREVTEANGRTHRVLTGDYDRWVGRWEPSVLPVGQVLRQPQPLFKKLDEKVIEEELARMQSRLG
ncbi:methionine--tRNA ligase [Chloroflexus aggregans]|uniref:Methionine--tRNA ligase n=1 Tax=Chloroflexus aggregans (strain MD-66 / DSM 9485) TaxID=326427 RepID=SYM_CHLAD|nr:methionine--tRNA ligase [Chloroflexus aggregans]B8G6F7.1 RecName: Full=Methionine--tRNA ligase; AltName: Full=Methionyl-tRNA synthetase; Short=MetRS [Chloroflexus aggregans DSM 9485]ACL23894.1 methionyl-tRNA synthetase [Chloroflexus aggregans DSM 9485]